MCAAHVLPDTWYTSLINQAKLTRIFYRNKCNKLQTSQSKLKFYHKSTLTVMCGVWDCYLFVMLMILGTAMSTYYYLCTVVQLRAGKVDRCTYVVCAGGAGPGPGPAITDTRSAGFGYLVKTCLTQPDFSCLAY